MNRALNNFILQVLWRRVDLLNRQLTEVFLTLP